MRAMSLRMHDQLLFLFCLYLRARCTRSTRPIAHDPGIIPRPSGDNTDAQSPPHIHNLPKHEYAQRSLQHAPYGRGNHVGNG